MRVSNKCVELVKEFEGLYLHAYQDSVDVWTIGYGITNADKAVTKRTIKKGMTITEATANKWLVDCLNKIYLPKVLKYQDKYHFNTSQIDGLVSFAYNIGSVDGLTKNGTRNIREIEYYIHEYNKAGGKILPGLVRRRLAETNLFNGGKKKFDEGLPNLPERGYFQQGDKGTKVKKIQRFLAWIDFYDGDIDGVYGAKTTAAVKRLQKFIKTPQNGKFGNKCLPFAKTYKK